MVPSLGKEKTYSLFVIIVISQEKSNFMIFFTLLQSSNLGGISDFFLKRLQSS